MILTLVELSRQVVAIEGIIKKLSALMTEKSVARSKPKGKGHKGKKKSISKGPKVNNGPNGGVAKAKSGTGAKPKGKYFHRGMIGHWKRNCPDFLSKEETMIE